MTQQEKATQDFFDYEKEQEKLNQSPWDAFKDALKGGDIAEKQSLLDDFAKAAMQAIMGNDALRNAAVKDSREHGMYHTDFVAQCAYDIAEAMMKERDRRMKG